MSTQTLAEPVRTVNPSDPTYDPATDRLYAALRTDRALATSTDTWLAWYAAIEADLRAQGISPLDIDALMEDR